MKRDSVVVPTALCLAVLVAGCATLPSGGRPEAQVNATRATVAALSVAIDLFEVDCGRYPTEAEGLSALVQNPGVDGWQGPYVRGENVFVDPWGTALKLTTHPGKSYRVFSAGPDRVFGSADDIGVDQ